MKFKITNRSSNEPKLKYKIRFSSINIDNMYIIFVYFGTKVMWLKWDKPRTPKQMYRNYKFKLTRWLQRKEKRFDHWYKYNFGDEPVYVSIWSRDCDMCESTSFSRFENFREYYDWYTDPETWEWLEGPMSVDFISRGEWLDNVNKPRRVRDRIMEAYENGRGSSIYV